MVESWTDAAAVSTGGLTFCGAKTWWFENTSDSSAIDDDVFTVDLTNPSKTVTAFTMDISKAATYALTVKVHYDDY